MDRMETPSPLPSGAGGGQLGPCLPQPLQTEQELKERAAAAVLQLPCQGVQGQQVVLPLLPTGHGPEQAQQIGLFVDVPDQLLKQVRSPAPKRSSSSWVRKSWHA